MTSDDYHKEYYRNHKERMNKQRNINLIKKKWNCVKNESDAECWIKFRSVLKPLLKTLEKSEDDKEQLKHIINNMFVTEETQINPEIEGVDI
jgi:hypothetical protein